MITQEQIQGINGRHLDTQRDIVDLQKTGQRLDRTVARFSSSCENHWVDDARKGMENALRANPLDVKEQYEKKLRDLQEAYGEAMLEFRARKKWQALMEREDDK